MSNEYKDYLNDLHSIFVEKMHEVEFLYGGWQNSFVPNMMNEMLFALGPYVEDFEVYQIKEKFGSLTIYWGWKHRDYTDEENNDRKNIDDAIHDIIDKYRKISERTCVNCGNKATFLSNSWIIPWCDNCRSRDMGVYADIEVAIKELRRYEQAFDSMKSNTYGNIKEILD